MNTPTLTRFTGTVANAVRSSTTAVLCDATGQRITVSVTPDQAAQASALHTAQAPVEAVLAPRGNGYRLVSIRDARTPRLVHSPQARMARILAKWYTLLQRLAQ